MTFATLLALSGRLGWVAFLTAVALLVVLRSVLPPERRRRLRGPVALLLVHLLFLGARALAGAGRAGRALELLAALALALALIRLLFSVVFDAFPLARDRLPKILQDVFLGVAYFVALMALFGASGVELSSILTTSALLTAVVAFALQDTLGNVISGLAIQIQKPFVVGDWVSLDGRPENHGMVTEINWRVTRLLTNELIEVLIPNSVIAKNTVVNFSQPSKVARRSVRVCAGYDVPPARVEEVALRTMRSCPGVLASPAPECVFESFGDSGVNYWCHLFIDDFRRREAIVGTVGSRLYYEFMREGITIPYPIRTVHVHERGREEQRWEQEHRVRQLVERFQGIDFLAPLGAEALEALARRVRPVAFGSGEAIVREGEPGTDFYLLERGEVSVTVDGGAKPHEIARLTTGDFFGEMSLMTGETRRATVVALGDVQAVRVDKDSFREVLAENSAVVEEISRVLALRQTALDGRAASMPAEPQEAIKRRSAALVDVIRRFFSL